MLRIMGGWVDFAIAGAALLLAGLTPGDVLAQQRPDEAILDALRRFTQSITLGTLGLGSPPTTLPGPSPAPPPFPAPSMLPPGGGVPIPPPPPMLAPPAQLAPAPNPPPAASSSPVALALNARYGREMSQPITGGLVWRIYPAKPDQTGAFRLLKEDKSAAPNLALPPGDYVVHVSFGLASAAKTVHVRSTDTTREIFDIPAGGIRLEGRVGDVRIPAGQISFDVYRGSQFDQGEKRALAEGIMTGNIIVVSEGTYHIVSNYGDANAVVRSDIRVQPGKLTDVTVTHRAAVVTLKLVGERGGEALANTNWTVLTPVGDVIKESTGAFPRVILAEGDYRAIARNENKTYEREFKIITGVDGEIEILAR